MVGDRCLGRRQARETYTASPTNTILKRSRSGPPVFAYFLSIIRIAPENNSCAFNSISRQVFERTPATACSQTAGERADLIKVDYA